MVYGGGTAIQILLKQGVLFADDFVDISRVRDWPNRGDRRGLHVGPMVSLRRMETDAGSRSGPGRRDLRSGGQPAGPQHRERRRQHRPRRLPARPADSPGGPRRDRRAASVAGPAGLGARVLRRLPGNCGRARRADHRHQVPRQPAAARGGSSSSAASARTTGRGAAAAWPTGPGSSSASASAPWRRPATWPSTDAGMDEQRRSTRPSRRQTAIDPIADIRGSADYKTQLGRVAVEDAVREPEGCTMTETATGGTSGRWRRLAQRRGHPPQRSTRSAGSRHDRYMATSPPRAVPHVAVHRSTRPHASIARSTPRQRRRSRASSPWSRGATCTPSSATGCSPGRPSPTSPAWPWTRCGTSASPPRCWPRPRHRARGGRPVTSSTRTSRRCTASTTRSRRLLRPR